MYIHTQLAEEWGKGGRMNGPGGGAGFGSTEDRSVTDLQEQRPHLLRATPSDLGSVSGVHVDRSARKTSIRQILL